MGYYDELTERYAKRLVEYGVEEIVAKNILQQFTEALKSSDEEMCEAILCNSQTDISITRKDNKTEITHGNGAFHIRTLGVQNAKNNYGIISSYSKFPDAVKALVAN